MSGETFTRATLEALAADAAGRPVTALRSPCCGARIWRPFADAWDRMCSWCGAHACTGWMWPGWGWRARSPESAAETLARCAMQFAQRWALRPRIAPPAAQLELFGGAP